MSESSGSADRPNPVKLLVIVLLGELSAVCAVSAAANCLAVLLQPRTAWAQLTALFVVMSVTGTVAILNVLSVVASLAIVERADDPEMCAFAKRAMPLTGLQTIVLVAAGLFAPPPVNLALALIAAAATAAVIRLMPGKARLPDDRRS